MDRAVPPFCGKGAIAMKQFFRLIAVVFAMIFLLAAAGCSTKETANEQKNDTGL